MTHTNFKYTSLLRNNNDFILNSTRIFNLSSLSPSPQACGVGMENKNIIYWPPASLRGANKVTYRYRANIFILNSKSFSTKVEIKDFIKINQLNYKEINKNDFSLVKGSYEYLRSIAEYRKLNWSPRSSNDWLHFKLGCIYFEEQFKVNLLLFLNSLQTHQSYSILFDCISDEGEIISLDSSYLINNDTNPDILISTIKRILEDKAFKYGVDVYSHIAIRYAGLSIKVENPVFRDSPTTRKIMSSKKISHRFLSSKYVPFTMEYEKYSIITNRYVNDFKQY